MAPPCGRAVLLFRARCGCPVAKLEAWGNKRGKKHNKLPLTALRVSNYLVMITSPLFSKLCYFGATEKRRERSIR
ncbi:hypothetical protein Scep_009283 [Stephania cephalantha]|uniref:Uncharacterized protein n=1 Tax=Stephania cephalantha TaxID=152367 RepID=A0AAP0JSZ4_9MAGN